MHRHLMLGAGLAQPTHQRVKHIGRRGLRGRGQRMHKIGLHQLRESGGVEAWQACHDGCGLRVLTTEAVTAQVNIERNVTAVFSISDSWYEPPHLQETS